MQSNINKDVEYLREKLPYYFDLQGLAFIKQPLRIRDVYYIAIISKDFRDIPIEKRVANVYEVLKHETPEFLELNSIIVTAFTDIEYIKSQLIIDKKGKNV